MNTLMRTLEKQIHTINSREVSEMVGKRHDHLIRDIRTYADTLKKSTAPKVGESEFFIETSYTDNTGRSLPCYECTKKGCEMIAHKMTGEKGILFTAAYINRFHELESQSLPQSLPEALRLYADALEDNKALQTELDTSKEWYSIKRVASLNNVSWKTFDWRKLKKESEQSGFPVKKIFDANYGEVNLYHQSVWGCVYPQYEL